MINMKQQEGSHNLKMYKENFVSNKRYHLHTVPVEELKGTQLAMYQLKDTHPAMYQPNDTNLNLHHRFMDASKLYPVPLCSCKECPWAGLISKSAFRQNKIKGYFSPRVSARLFYTSLTKCTKPKFVSRFTILNLLCKGEIL